MEKEVKVGANFKYTWTVKNFSKLTRGDMHYSRTLFTFPYTWYVFVRTRLHCSFVCWDIDNFYVDDKQRISANVKLSLVNQLETNSTIIKDRENFQPIDVHDDNDDSIVSIHLDSEPQNGFILNNTCIIVAEVSVNYLEVLIHNHHQRPLINFKGLCKIEKEYAEVLEESCSKHPSLIECHRKRKRSQRFNECSFTALGKLLHFLKTKKVKDMKSDAACKELQYLWDEVEIRFDDLGWLEPHVKFALTYFEKESKVEKLKGDAADLKEKLKTLNADLETTETELAKAEEGFIERYLDDQLGFDDLTWLEPHVRIALSMKDKEEMVTKLKGDVVDLEERVKKAKEELAIAEEGFVKRDLNDESGHGIP
ncbi:hypothetical protein PIB30_053831 [Stylosanthes scabra]|uniref:MATH domain-containing protein n=1 Tax=Stylosanthes scabra TaxID=79078 RepID=A0ABU6TIB1_9FABA|nr:hypothetical protein [Stylosanthes scabra]